MAQVRVYELHYKPVFGKLLTELPTGHFVYQIHGRDTPIISDRELKDITDETNLVALRLKYKWNSEDVYKLSYEDMVLMLKLVGECMFDAGN